ncbi:hypothetical protein BpHYR1_014774 [Brachionus plicatilis]|uniref:Uncharacterized protein n=1 Tax=Brachionus plicatilis TaxID=10195 RepID=A0A3M7RW93_BRAPC|nr:hypothetical protein BpHYR1_014774 [Brachionus plicatilis]
MFNKKLESGEAFNASADPFDITNSGLFLIKELTLTGDWTELFFSNNNLSVLTNILFTIYDQQFLIKFFSWHQQIEFDRLRFTIDDIRLIYKYENRLDITCKAEYQGILFIN